jgi:hypothetical protein
MHIPVIVTPGNEKYRETHSNPFRTVMTAADKALRSAQSYLCIGYGFNDDHIQELIINENRTKKKPVVIITKEITESINRLFLQCANSNFLCIVSNGKTGTMVYFSKDEYEEFSEQYWRPENFYNLWF